MRTGERFARRRNECRRLSSFTATRAKDLTPSDPATMSQATLANSEEQPLSTPLAQFGALVAADSDKIPTLSGNAPRGLLLCIFGLACAVNWLENQSAPRPA